MCSARSRNSRPDTWCSRAASRACSASFLSCAELLVRAGFHVTVETAATIFPVAAVPHVHLWSLSPKLPSAGAGYLRHPVIGRFVADVPRDRVQWKFVVRDDADEHALRTLLEQYPAFRAGPAAHHPAARGRERGRRLPGGAGETGGANARLFLGRLPCPGPPPDAFSHLGIAPPGVSTAGAGFRVGCLAFSLALPGFM